MKLFDIEPIVDTEKEAKSDDKEVLQEARKVGKELDVDNLLEGM